MIKYDKFIFNWKKKPKSKFSEMDLIQLGYEENEDYHE